MENLKKLLSAIGKSYDKQSCMISLLSDNGIDIIPNGGDKLGNCYYSNCYKVYSDKELTKEFILYLRDLNLIGYGQECSIYREEVLNNRYCYSIVNRVDSSD